MSLPCAGQKGRYQFVVATHVDRGHIHNHIIYNAVSEGHDRKYRNFWGSTFAVRRASDRLCLENNLSIVENPKPTGKSYGEWLGDKKPPSGQEKVRRGIDAAALAEKPADLSAFSGRYGGVRLCRPAPGPLPLVSRSGAGEGHALP